MSEYLSLYLHYSTLSSFMFATLMNFGKGTPTTILPQPTSQVIYHLFHFVWLQLQTSSQRKQLTAVIVTKRSSIWLSLQKKSNQRSAEQTPQQPSLQLLWCWVSSQYGEVLQCPLCSPSTIQNDGQEGEGSLSASQNSPTQAIKDRADSWSNISAERGEAREEWDSSEARDRS